MCPTRADWAAITSWACLVESVRASGLPKDRISSGRTSATLYRGRIREKSMRTTLTALGFAAGIGLICCQSANAVPTGTTTDGASTAHLQQLAMMGAGGRDARQVNRDAHSTHKQVKPKH